MVMASGRCRNRKSKGVMNTENKELSVEITMDTSGVKKAIENVAEEIENIPVSINGDPAAGMKEAFKRIGRDLVPVEVVHSYAINQLVEFCHAQAKSAGWHDQPRETGTMLALIHSEISEAMEGDRKGLMDDHLPNRKMFEVELADAVIRIFDLAGLHGLDLGGAIEEKLLYNMTRHDHKRENRAADGGKKY